MVEELDGEHKVGNGPAVDPARAVLALSSPLPLLQLPLPYMLTLATHQPGGLVQREEDVVAGVGVRQEGGEVELLSSDFEDKGNGVGEEVGEGKSELDGEKLAADCQEGIFRVAAKINHSFESRMSFIEEKPARRVNPVELIGRGSKLKLFENELEAPGVWNEA